MNNAELIAALRHKRQELGDLLSTLNEVIARLEHMTPPIITTKPAAPEGRLFEGSPNAQGL